MTSNTTRAYTVSLKDNIAAYIAQYRDWDSDTDLANAIIALVRAHLTSDEAVERAGREYNRKWEASGSPRATLRAAISAALGEGK